jgi:hypothetical protein
MTFNKHFFIFTILIFSIEISIALFLDSGFIRYTFGDVLASILIYTALRSFIVVKPRVSALVGLGISFLIEGLQLFQFTTLINQKDNTFLNLVLGNHFSVGDLIAYTIGVLLIYTIDKKFIYETL